MNMNMNMNPGLKNSPLIKLALRKLVVNNEKQKMWQVMEKWKLHREHGEKAKIPPTALAWGVCAGQRSA